MFTPVQFSGTGRNWGPAMSKKLKPEGLHQDDAWVETARETELAGQALDLQAQVHAMGNALIKSAYANPPNPEGVRLIKQAIRAGLEKLAEQKEDSERQKV